MDMNLSASGKHQLVQNTTARGAANASTHLLFSTWTSYIFKMYLDSVTLKCTLAWTQFKDHLTL